MTEIETSDVVERLVGIRPLYLNNFLQRGLYGVKASVQQGKLRVKRRIFSREDVFGIALVWMLFEAGLRTDPIRRILRTLGGTKKADANFTAQNLLESGAEYIAVIREPRRPRQEGEPSPEIRTAEKADLAQIVERNPTANLLFVPVRQKFEEIQKRLEVLY